MTDSIAPSVPISQEEGLSEVQSSILVEDSDAEKKLKVVLEELSMTCARYTTISKSSSSGSGTGKTKLDKERTKMCLREIVSFFPIIVDLFPFRFKLKGAKVGGKLSKKVSAG